MSEAGLDPVVEKVMEIALDQSNTDMLHSNDRCRWMSLFPALIAAGYSLDINAIFRWLDKRWPVPPNESGMDDHHAIEVYAWADMALHQSNPSDWAGWAEGTIRYARDELAG